MPLADIPKTAQSAQTKKLRLMTIDTSLLRSCITREDGASCSFFPGGEQKEKDNKVLGVRGSRPSLNRQVVAGRYASELSWSRSVWLCLTGTLEQLACAER